MFCWEILGQAINVDVALICITYLKILQTIYTLLWKQYPLMAVASFTRVAFEHWWDMLDKQVRSMEAPSHNLQDLKVQYHLGARYHSTPSWV